MANSTSSVTKYVQQTPIILSPESSPFKKRDLHNEANIRNNLCNSTPRSVKRQFNDAFDLSPVQSSKKFNHHHHHHDNTISNHNSNNNSYSENNNSEADDTSSLIGGENNENSARRGRPKLDAIKCLISNASDSKSAIRCHTCNRVFPREKSLQAHIRTHTGEKPYVCNFAGCTKRFTQSGQLRTHQRLHTGEKPFACRSQGCNNRFTHANRRCPLHPQHGVRRDRLSSNTQLVVSSKHHLLKENQTSTSINKKLNQQMNNNKNNHKDDNVQKEVVNWLKKQDQKTSSQLSSSNLIDNCGIKRKLNGRPIRKIKKPKFLDDSSSSSSSSSEEEEENLTNQFNQIDELINEEDDNCAQLIWKKKRAALELHAKESHSSHNTSFKKLNDTSSSSDHHQLNQDDCVNQSMNYSLDEVMLNKLNSSLDEHGNLSFQDDDVYCVAEALIELSKSRPIVEYSSEIDLSIDYTVHDYSVCNEVQVEHCSDYLASSQGDYSDIHYSYHEEYY